MWVAFTFLIMEILQLNTRPQTLDVIRKGDIKEYAREIRPKTQEKYCEIDEDGYVKDIDGVLQPRHYDAVKFVCGHESYTCKIEKAWIELFENENHEFIIYTENNEEYLAAQVVYLLGERITL